MTGGTKAQKSDLLPKLAGGELKLAFAYAERQSRFDLNDVECKAVENGDAFEITGHKGVVFHAATADKIIVSARTSGDSRNVDGITLFLVDNNSEGLSRRDYPTVDGLRASELEMTKVNGTPLGEVGAGATLMEEVLGQAIAAICAEAEGCMEVMQETNKQYLNHRVQFGVPL